MVAGRRSQIAVRCRVVDQLDLAEQAIFQIGRDFLRPDVVDEKLAQPVIPEAHDHDATPSEALYHAMTHIASARGGWYLPSSIRVAPGERARPLNRHARACPGHP